MATASVIATNDGLIYTGASTYVGARDVTAGTAVQTTDFTLGQQYVNPTYYVVRDFASFAIPDMSALTAASLFLYGYEDGSTTDFTAAILTSTYNNPLVVADVDQFDGWQSSGAYNGTLLNDAWSSTSYQAGWNEIAYNAAGLAAILAKKNDTFKIAILSSRDYAGTACTGDEFIRFYSSVTAGKEPYLSITYDTYPNVSKSISVTVEMESALTRKLTFPISPLVEMECAGTLFAGLVKAISITLGMTASAVRTMIKPISPLLEMEATGTRQLTKPISVTVNVGADLTERFANTRQITINLASKDSCVECILLFNDKTDSTTITLYQVDNVAGVAGTPTEADIFFEKVIPSRRPVSFCKEEIMLMLTGTGDTIFDKDSTGWANDFVYSDVRDDQV